MSLVEARQLGKVYRAGSRGRICALEDVSLDIPTGALVLLRGPSGSGKTTLLALLAGLERPTSGQVSFAGKDLGTCSGVELARVRRRIGFVFQDFALIPGLPVWENVAYPLIPRGVPRSERARLAEELLGRFDLADRRMARPVELSGGEQQRVALARALAGRPELIVADEPTSNLDEQAGQRVIALLEQVRTDGRTLIVSSHDARFLGSATMVYELERGRLKTTRLDERPNPPAERARDGP